MPTIRLSAETLELVWTEAIKRQHEAMIRGFKTNNRNTVRRELLWNIGACMVEAATAIYLESDWTGRNNGQFEAGLYDVAPNIEARYSTGQGPLRVRSKDDKRPPSTPYVLGWVDDVFTSTGEVTLKGWLPLDDCYRHSVPIRRGETIVYETDPEHLYPLAQLKGLIHENR